MIARKSAVGLAAIALAMTFTIPALADTGMLNGSANVNKTKARCSPGDPNVMLNLKSKTYVLDSTGKGANGRMSSTMADETGDQPGAKTAGGHSGTEKASSVSMKSVCRSEAISMGAHKAS